MITGAYPLSRPVRISEATAGEGETIAFEATPAECAAVAAAFDLPEVKRFAASMTLAWETGAAVHVTGEVHAEIVQTCVVTLEPVAQSVTEAIDLRLVPEGVAVKASSTGKTGSEGNDPPETYSGDWVDLGVLAVEHFAVGIDPYPRAPGVEFQPTGAELETAEKTSPFAELARLRPPPKANR